jgi:hypothetical protein
MSYRLNPHFTKNLADLYKDGTLKNGDTVMAVVPEIHTIYNITEIKTDKDELDGIYYTVNNRKYKSDFRESPDTMLDKHIKICGNSQSSPVQSSPGATLDAQINSTVLDINATGAVGGGGKKKSKKQRNRKRRTRRN